MASRKPPLRSLVRIMAAFCTLGFGAVPSFAGSLESAKDRLAALEKKAVEENRVIGQTSERLERLSSEIRALRKKKDPTLLERYRLGNRLREAQEVSDRLANLTDTRRESEAARKAARAEVARELDAAIESKRRVANALSESWPKRSTAAREMDRLLLERMRFSADPLALSLPSTAAPLFRAETPKEEVEERLTALRDLEHRMETEAALLSTELSEVRKQRFLRNELSHLMDEEAFFAEGGFVRVAGARPAEKTAAPPTSPQPSNTDPAASVASAPGDAPAAIRFDAPATEPGRVERDPLALLASEFGFYPEQKRDAQTRTASGDTHIQWLENRIATLQWILDHLRNKTQELERQAARP